MCGPPKTYHTSPASEPPSELPASVRRKPFLEPATSVPDHQILAHLSEASGVKPIATGKLANVPVDILFDSGNLWRSAMSYETYKRLPKDFQELAKTNEQVLAANRSPIEVVGILKHAINLRFDGVRKPLQARFAVIKGLTNDVNLSYAFLRHFKICLSPDQNTATVDNRVIHLRSDSTTVCNLVTASAVQLQPRDRGAQWVTLKLTSSAIPPETLGIVDTSPSALNGLHCEAMDNALVTTNANCEIHALVYNHLNEQSFIPAFSHYGQFTVVDETLSRPTTSAILAQLTFQCESQLAALRAANDQSTASAPPSPISANDKAAVETADALAAAAPTHPRGRSTARAPLDSLPPRSRRRSREPSPKRESPTVSRQELSSKFRLHLSDALTSQAQREKLLDVLFKHQKAFSFNGEIGHTDLMMHRIPTKPGTVPVNQRYRPLNPILEEELFKQLREWLDQKVIEAGVSEWNSALVPVRKKDGRTRFCLDFRGLNLHTEKDRHPIGDVNDLLSRLAASRVFSCLDNSGAYLAVSIHPRDRHKTAFNSPYGSFVFRKMAFGLATAPSAYARLVQLVLYGKEDAKDPLGRLPKGILPYLDDTILHSKESFEEHLSLLDWTLGRFEAAGLKLAPAKCDLFRRRLKFLGHIVSGEGLGTCPEYAKIVAEWPLPTTRKEVRVFYGKVSYYRKFLRDLARRSSEITDKLKDDGTKDTAKFIPSPLFVKQFRDLRQALVSAPILAHPDFEGEPFILDTDFSVEHNQAGAVLSQEQDGRERVICYGSVRLNQAQRNYDAHKGELAALFIFAKKWKYYLQSKKFLFRTDCEALKFLRTQQQPKSIFARWQELLAQMDFDILHRKREHHQNADSLTRVPHAQEDPENNDWEEEQVLGALVTAPATARYASLADKLKDSQRADRELNLLIDLLSRAEEPSILQRTEASAHNRYYFQAFKDLLLDKEGRLCLRLPGSHDTPFRKPHTVLVLPQDCYDEAATALHLESCHKGRDELIRLLKLRFHVFKARELAERTIEQCVPCQKARPAPKPQSFHHHPMVAGYPFQVLSIDFVTNLPKINNYTCLFTVKCQHTRFVEAFPCSGPTSEVAIRKLSEEIFPRYSYCESIHCDNGASFTSHAFKTFCSDLRINLIFSPPYNPSSQVVERSHLDIKNLIRRMTTESNLNWLQCLPAVLFSIRTAANSSIGTSAFEAVFGRSPTAALHLFFGRADDAAFPDSVEQIKHVQRVNDFIRKNIALYVRRQRRAYTGKAVSFKVRDFVWLFTPIASTPNSRKFATYWTGPWQIAEKHNEVVYRLMPHPSWPNRRSPWVGVDRLLPYKCRTENEAEAGIPPDPETDFAMVGDEFAENVYAHDPEESFPLQEEPPIWPMPYVQPEYDHVPQRRRPPPQPDNPPPAPDMDMGEGDQEPPNFAPDLPEQNEDLNDAQQFAEPPPPPAARNRQREQEIGGAPPRKQLRIRQNEVRDVQFRAQRYLGDDFDQAAKRPRKPPRSKQYDFASVITASRQQGYWRSAASMTIRNMQRNLRRSLKGLDMAGTVANTISCLVVDGKAETVATLSRDWLIKRIKTEE